MAGRQQQRADHGRSTELWMEGEAAEKAGQSKKAIQLFAQAAIAEEDGGDPLRARLLWEQISHRVGLTSTVLERLAAANERAKLLEDAFDLWRAAAVCRHAEGREEQAAQAKERARLLKPRTAPHALTELAEKALQGADLAYVTDLDG
ncbi:MAG: hypothetical protein RL199_1874 [Pseudomonadota bacterium]|jgi:tetratricopeptide (TPR) repeat protein